MGDCVMVSEMPSDQTAFLMKVVGWSQSIGHGDVPLSTFGVSARISEAEDLVIGPEGSRTLLNMPVHLSIIRGTPEQPAPILGGIGVLVYEGPAQYDAESTEEFIRGWFWLPENSFDELRALARDHRSDECDLAIWFGPVEPEGETSRWNTEKDKFKSIKSVNVRFEWEGQHS